jgi:hypothetical protein
MAEILRTIGWMTHLALDELANEIERQMPRELCPTATPTRCPDTHVSDAPFVDAIGSVAELLDRISA